MKPEIQNIKSQEIEKAAYKLLEAKGYEATSMLSIAKASKTSNQTLYKWYGDKRGLFSEMVAENASATRIVLENAIEQNTSTMECLKEIGPILLTMVTGEKAIALNRAAAADHSNQLGEAISRSGRESVFPLIKQLMKHGLENKEFTNGNDTELTALYLNLLIGDLQIRRAIGVLKPLSEKGIEERATYALEALKKLSG